MTEVELRATTAAMRASAATFGRKGQHSKSSTTWDGC